MHIIGEGIGCVRLQTPSIQILSFSSSNIIPKKRRHNKGLEPVFYFILWCKRKFSNALCNPILLRVE
jgi:hypothetical protein